VGISHKILRSIIVSFVALMFSTFITLDIIDTNYLTKSDADFLILFDLFL